MKTYTKYQTLEASALLALATGRSVAEQSPTPTSGVQQVILVLKTQ